MTANIRDYFLASPMTGKEYPRLKITHVSEDIHIQYNLHEKVTSDRYIYI